MQTLNLTTDDFEYFVDRFEDFRVLKYKVPHFDSLALKQKEFIYYMSKAALSGRDILWDQNFKHNLVVRKTLEAILEHYNGERSSDEYACFLIYVKKVFFANGIHHHYSNDKFRAGFSKGYLKKLIEETDITHLPLEEKQSADELISFLELLIFDETLFGRKTELKSGLDVVKESAINFYQSVSQMEVEDFYSERTNPDDPRPVSLGLNSRVVKREGEIFEEVFRSEGLYGPVIDKIIMWIEKAITVAPTELHKKELEVLVDFYRTGDLKRWDEYNVLWTRNTGSEVDYTNGFIETYSDPMGMKATWEAIVNYTDTEATKRMQLITANAQWFEDNSPVQTEYKKEKVIGVAAKVINIAMLGGDCYPASPLGINLPNANWIRKEVGSKSVRLANIIDAYDITSKGNGFLEEFAADQEEIERNNKFGIVAEALHTDLHECVGHAGGKLAEGTDPHALKNYSSSLEEARADLFALYYIMDKKLLDLGLLPDLDAAKASYDTYLRNGLLTQVVRIKPGKDIEEAHMRNRAAISNWVYESGRKDNVVTTFRKNNKTYIKINDYNKLRTLFGVLLREIQRIKSEGDFEAGKNLIEKYGVKIDSLLHTEILERYEKLNLAPYTGFVNPNLFPVFSVSGNITDVKVEYVNDYLGQMLEYGRNYSFL